MRQIVRLPGYPDPPPVFHLTQGDLAGQDVAQVRRIGLVAQVVQRDVPATIVKVPIGDRVPVEHLAQNHFATGIAATGGK